MRVYSGGGRRVAAGAGQRRPARGGKRLQSAKKRRRAPKILLTAAGVTLVACLVLVRGAGLPEKVFGEEPKEQELIPLTEARPAESEPIGAQREEGHFLLSFAGDCTLGTEHGSWGKSGTFPEVVGENYAYPFAGVQSLFAQDDFTFVNLEGALTSHTVPAEKQYRFRGPTAYGAILTEGSVEAVTLANNHTLDYGKTGLQETRQVLKDLGVAAGGDGETFLYTTSQGLKIGVYTAYHFGKPQIRQSIETLQSQGAEIIVAAFHSGAEGSYTPTARQKDMFRYAADCGAHIVYNSHPHVLQPMERYGDSVILYSLGNFSFGGNRNPSDKEPWSSRWRWSGRRTAPWRFPRSWPIPALSAAASTATTTSPPSAGRTVPRPGGWSRSWRAPIGRRPLSLSRRKRRPRPQPRRRCRRRNRARRCRRRAYSFLLPGAEPVLLSRRFWGML